jgi:hypothetical protein
MISASLLRLREPFAQAIASRRTRPLGSCLVHYSFEEFLNYVLLTQAPEKHIGRLFESTPRASRNSNRCITHRVLLTRAQYSPSLFAAQRRRTCQRNMLK